MSSLITELRQYALMAANHIKISKGGDEEFVKRAYERVKSFGGVICPECWVNKELSSELEIEANASATNGYVCKECGFNRVLPKP